jgi:hypothetical protein
MDGKASKTKLKPRRNIGWIGMKIVWCYIGNEWAEIRVGMMRQERVERQASDHLHNEQLQLVPRLCVSESSGYGYHCWLNDG